MKSKFTVKSFLILALSIAFIFLICKIIPTFFINPYYDNKLFPKIFVPILIIFTLIYLVSGELRTKCIQVELGKDKIKVKRFLGLKKENYTSSEIDGWKYSLLPSRGGTYEYLYLYKNNKKVVKISEFYHSNYKQLKFEIQRQYRSLGYEKFSYFDEFKEIFT